MNNEQRNGNNRKDIKEGKALHLSSDKNNEKLNGLPLSGGDTKPGAVAVTTDALSQLDARIAQQREKQDLWQQKPADTTTGHSMSNTLSDGKVNHTSDSDSRDNAGVTGSDQDFLAKQPYNSTQTKPGAIRATAGSASPPKSPTRLPPALSLFQMERDAMAKSRAPVESTSSSPRLATLQLESDVLAKTQAMGNVSTPNSAGRSLGHLESEVLAKNQSTWGSSVTIPSALSLSQLENDVLAKNQTMGVPSAAMPPGSSLSRLENDVLAKNQVSGVSAAVVDANRKGNGLLQDEGKWANGNGQEGTAAFGGRNELMALENSVAKSSIRFQERAPRTAVSDAASRPGYADDTEFGQINETDKNLAVAMPVNEEVEDGVLPTAIEYDTDAKPAAIRRRRCRLYSLFAVFSLIVVGVGISVGVLVLGKGGDKQIVAPTLAPTSFRESELRQSIESIVGTDRLADPTGPYSKALDWVMYDDPFKLTPANNTFYQRYFAAYLYLATSVEKPWSTDCAPTGDSSASACTFTEYFYFNVASRFEYKYAKPTPWSRWLSDVPECSWAGVLCDDQNQIRSIVLRGFNMTGKFPEGIQFFPFLQEIIVFWGELRGTIPSDIARLKALDRISFRANELSGSIPTELWSMPSIHFVDFGANQLTGTFPTEMVRMVDLKSSIIHNNQLASGTLPTEVGLLKSLYYMYWNANRLIGTIPTEIGNCRTLYTVGLSDGALTGTIPTELGRLNISALDLSRNRLTGPIPTQILSLPRLEVLYVEENALTGTLGTYIGNLTYLHFLNVQQNQLTGSIPSELGGLENLQGVYMNGNRFNGSMPEAVCQARGSSFVELVADCLPHAQSGFVQVDCPSNCCSLCCSSNSLSCGVHSH